MRIVMSTRAQAEVADSWLWYEEREVGLGDRFVGAVKQKLKVISENPEMFPLKQKPFRETIIAIFPFVVVYKVNKKQKLIEIISIFHTSRSPRKKY